MILEIGVDVTIKRALWVKARLDYEPLFSIMDGLRQDAGRQFWIERIEIAQQVLNDLGRGIHASRKPSVM